MAIRSIATTFTLASYRHLKSFIGELTAAVTANEVALRHGSDHAAALNEPDPWSTMGARYQIKINGIRSETIASTSAKLHIVSLYSGFDGFLRSVRREWQNLSGRSWIVREGDGPFEEFVRNTPLKPQDFHELVGASLEIAVDHYRKVRNAIVHPSDDITTAANEYHQKHQATLRELGILYGFTTAPHALENTDFHDTKLLSRLVLDTAKRVSCAFDPGDDALGATLPDSLLDGLRGTVDRRRNRLQCFLRTKYGLSEERAVRVVGARLEVH